MEGWVFCRRAFDLGQDPDWDEAEFWPSPGWEAFFRQVVLAHERLIHPDHAVHPRLPRRGPRALRRASHRDQLRFPAELLPADDGRSRSDDRKDARSRGRGPLHHPPRRRDRGTPAPPPEDHDVGAGGGAAGRHRAEHRRLHAADHEQPDALHHPPGERPARPGRPGAAPDLLPDGGLRLGGRGPRSAAEPGPAALPPRPRRGLPHPHSRASTTATATTRRARRGPSSAGCAEPQGAPDGLETGLEARRDPARARPRGSGRRDRSGGSTHPGPPDSPVDPLLRERRRIWSFPESGSGPARRSAGSTATTTGTSGPRPSRSRSSTSPPSEAA